MNKLVKVVGIGLATWAVCELWLSGPANDLTVSLAGVAATCMCGLAACGWVIFS